MKKILSIILICLFFFNYSNAEEKQIIGVLSAAVGEVSNQDGVKLNTGDKIYFGDTIKVNDKSNSQILLLDQTVLNVGAKSEVIIDEFVFDPSNNNGKILSQLKQGSMKVITGLISEKDPDNFVVKVPAGTIGTRGTEFQAIVNNDNQESKILLIGPGPGNTLGLRPGVIEVFNNLGSVVLDQPYTFTKMASNTPPDAPVVIPAAELNEFKKSLEAKIELIRETEQASQDDEVTKEILYVDKSKDEVLSDVLKNDDVILALSGEQENQLGNEDIANTRVVSSQQVINELSNLVSEGQLDIKEFFSLVGKDEQGNELRTLVKTNRVALATPISTIDNDDGKPIEEELFTNKRKKKIDKPTNNVEIASTVKARTSATTNGTYRYDSGTVTMSRSGNTIFSSGAYRSITDVNFDQKNISTTYSGSFTPVGASEKTFSGVSTSSTDYTSRPSQSFNFTLDSDGDQTTTSILDSSITKLGSSGGLDGDASDFSTGSSTVMVEYSSNDNSNYAGFGDFSTASVGAVGTSSLSIEQSSSNKGADLSTFQSAVETLSGSNSSITPTKQ
ncbi:FecR domain-containing protein [Candidatus Pelagibacter ubique]|nr:FecR domain-containing protein [Candidatus Pelagibacter ubique]